MMTSVLDFLYTVWCKILTMFGDIRLSVRLAQVTARDIRSMMKCVQPGDVIMRRYNAYLDGYFIYKRKYTHSGIVIDENTMVHAIAEGVQKVDIIDFVKDCDGFIILRPKYDHISQRNVVQKAHSLIGTPYDFFFQYGGPRLYCHECTNTALSGGGLDVKPQWRRIGLIKKYVVVDMDFLDAFPAVYETDTKSFARAFAHYENA